MDDKENQEKKLGLLNIRKARLVNWKELPYDYAKNYIPSRKNRTISVIKSILCCG